MTRARPGTIYRTQTKSSGVSFTQSRVSNAKPRRGMCFSLTSPARRARAISLNLFELAIEPSERPTLTDIVRAIFVGG